MSNNPTATLTSVPAWRRTRIQIKFCLASRILKTRNGDVSVVCTRIESHPAHCCDEVAGLAWDHHSSKPTTCSQDHDHSKEKGLCR